MKYLSSLNLRAKVTMYLSIVTIFFLLGFQVYVNIALEEQLRKDLNELADKHIERLSNELVNPMWELDEIAIKNVLSSEARDKIIHHINASDNENIDIRVNNISGGNHHKEDGHIHRTKPILYNGNKIGEVHLCVTNKYLNKRVSEDTSQAIILTIIQIIVIILTLMIIITRLIIRPIESLVKSTNLIAEGDYTYTKLKLSDDEIGALGDSIYRMRNKIELRENELKDSAEQLEKTKEQLEYAINGAQDGLWDWDLVTNEVYFSVRWKEMLGYKDDELTNSFETWETHMHPDDIEKAKHDVAFSQEVPGRFYENTHRLKHKDGSWVWILTRGQTIFNEEGKAVRMLGFHTDITKQKELENEILEQEEMIISQSRQAAMGEMIGMIAHQWRQPITVIAMGANNMLVDIELEEGDEDNFKKEANSILQQTEYLSKTIDDFRNFFRPNKEKDIATIEDVMSEAKKIIGTSLEYTSVVLTIKNGNNKQVETYSRELLQVFINLLKNAKEALLEHREKDRKIDVLITNDEKNVITTVCDNGGGISKENMEKIFEPYFSTKNEKTGTGLGLYMSKTIVEKHLKGTMTVENTADGACFIVTIPIESVADNNA